MLLQEQNEDESSFQPSQHCTSAEPYSCGECGGSFSQCSTLKGPVSLNCEDKLNQSKESEKTFASLVSLKGHEVIHNLKVVEVRLDRVQV